jgi:hypothetical protein
LQTITLAQAEAFTPGNATTAAIIVREPISFLLSIRWRRPGPD